MGLMKRLKRGGKRVFVDDTKTSPISNKHYEPSNRRIQRKKSRYDNKDVTIYLQDEDYDKSIGVDKRKWRVHDETYFDEWKDSNLR